MKYDEVEDCIWLKVSNDEYELPLAVADSAVELAELVGTTATTIYSSMSHVKHQDGQNYRGKYKYHWTPYRKIVIGRKIIVRNKVIVKRPDEPIGHMTHISTELSNLQKTVEGYIEAVTIRPGLVLICNEDGKFSNLHFNFRIPNDFIMGTAIILGTSGEDFADVPISLQEWKAMLKNWGNLKEE